MKRFNKKGVEMTTNTVVIIVLVLLVLVALVFFLTRGFTNFNRGTDCTANRGGSCENPTGIGIQSCPSQKPYVLPYRCDQGKLCCSSNPIPT